MGKLAVIGASYLQLPLVLKAKELGHRVYCFAWEDGAVCKDVADEFFPISITDKEAIFEKCRQIGIDGVLTIASDLAVLTVNYIAARLGLPGNDNRYSASMTNKYLMRKAFRDSGIPCPSFYEVSPVHPLDYSSLGPWPLIVKPTDRSGSRGVEKVADEGHLRKAISFAMEESLGKEVIVESFIEGREISVESISWKGRHYVLQITDKVTTGAPYFIELEHHQPSSLPENIQKEVRELVPRALDALHITVGASHTEIKITPEGKLYIIEIGARMGGDFIGSDLVRLSTGYDFLQGVIEVALGTFKEPVMGRKAYSGVYFLSEETQGLLRYFQHPEIMVDIIEAGITDPVLRPIRCSADRSGYLIYRSQTSKLVLK